MANTYSAGGTRTAAVLVGIVVLHIGFFWALKQGLVRGAVQLIQDFSIMDLPPPPPPPENLDEPPPPPPVDVPPPIVPPPLIDLPVFEGPTTAITARVVEAPPRAAPPQAPPRQVQITPARIKARSDRIAAAINACYPSASRRLSEEGRVMLTITISSDGKVGAMSVNQSSGFTRLDTAAECVVRRLPFEPGKRDGQPVDSQATLPIVFKLE
ncbi:MAG TPA: energy transducer TonB [Steroidobacteraceae bacterium]|nr:energy transducer TonB [Steroidobacteraceae bacterium]